MIEDVKVGNEREAVGNMPTSPQEPDKPVSLGKLVEQISEQASRLVRAEIALAKAEITEKATRSGIAIGLFVVAVLILVYAVGVLLLAAVYGLGTAWPLWLSALAIGSLMLIVTAVLALVGVRLLKQAMTKPESIQRVKDDIASIKEGMQR